MPVTLEQIEQCAELLTQQGATRIILFGTAAESPETARDLDLACAGIPFWTLLGLADRLQTNVGVPVDLVPLDPDDPFTSHVERWGKVLYERAEAK